MSGLRRAIGSRPVPLIACAAAGLVGAFGLVGVSVAASIVTLDKPAQVGSGAAAVRFDPPPAPASTPPPPPAASVPTEHQGLVRAVLVAINEVRSAAGLRSYEWNDAVALAAQQHSDDMAANGTMSHTGSDGSDAEARLGRAGFVPSWWAENIAAGMMDPGDLVRAWMASSGHRAHLLGDFRFAGVGVATSDQGTPYWTLDLAS